MRRPTLALTFALLLTLTVQAVGQRRTGEAAGEWRHYAGNAGSHKYSALDRINKDNVSRLKMVWRWTSPDNRIVSAQPLARPGGYQDTPIMAKGVLYTVTSLGQVTALDPSSGTERWSFDPESWKAGRPTNLGFVHRGLAYWTDGRRERLFVGTGDAYLLAIDARTGSLDPEFGEKGRVDLASGLSHVSRATNYAVTSAPVICRNVLVIGASINDGPLMKEAPKGDISGFDVVTGQRLWTFHSIPRPGEFGHETWEDGSWEYTGNTNVWTYMSADEELGYVYLPFGTPTNDFYGGHRPGNNLFAESLVALDARTGKRVWHFQGVHHGVWDYDFPAAPTLADITVSGKRVRAAIQVSKQGFIYVFDRRTGVPVWPIEERQVPPSTVPGERLSATQPFPTKPPPFESQGFGDRDLIDYTPELRTHAQKILERFDHGPLFTPPSLRGTVQMPGWAGGANFGGAAYDPETGMFYVPSYRSPIVVQLVAPDPSKSNFRYRRGGTMALPTIDGLPIWKGPYSRITAYDLNAGTIAWMTPTGDGPRNHPLIEHLELPPMGVDARGYTIATRTLLFHTHGGEGLRGGEVPEPFQGRPLSKALTRETPKIRALDKKTGAIVWEHQLPLSPAHAPMTYLYQDRQFIVVAVGGGLNAELVAFSLE
jgi:quinoprotein glucose dehydrogenase